MANRFRFCSFRFNVNAVEFKLHVGHVALERDVRFHAHDIMLCFELKIATRARRGPAELSIVMF